VVAAAELPDSMYWHRSRVRAAGLKAAKPTCVGCKWCEEAIEQRVGGGRGGAARLDVLAQVQGECS